MTNTEKIFLTLFLGAAFIILGFSRICLRKHPKVTSEEISIWYPNVSLAKAIYIAVYLTIIFVFLILFSVISSVIKKADYHVSLLVIAGICLLGLFEGFFSLATSVFPMTERYKPNQYVFDQGKKLKWISITQIALAASEIIICSLIFLFHS
jgi:hypothetical protein